MLTTINITWRITVFYSSMLQDCMHDKEYILTDAVKIIYTIHADQKNMYKENGFIIITIGNMEFNNNLDSAIFLWKKLLISLLKEDYKCHTLIQAINIYSLVIPT